MSDNSNIEWTDATWNPTVGCSVISAGCTNCYAMKMAGRLEMMGQPIYQGHTTKTRAGYVWNGKVAASNWGQVIKPLSWKKPRRIFVNSMSDLFHEEMPVEIIDQVFAVMALCPQHTFQVLTKRFSRMRDYCQTLGKHSSLDKVSIAAREIRPDSTFFWNLGPYGWHLPNVWLGASVEDQFAADYRIPALLETPAAVRFLSCEPLLGPVDLGRAYAINPTFHTKIDWVIAGGESGPERRPVDIAWIRSLRDQCADVSMPFFAKQIDKVIQLPSDLMIRQFPA